MMVAADDPSGGSIRFRLRAATSALHRDTERLMDLERRIATRDGYRELIARLYGFYVPLESALATMDWPSSLSRTRRLAKSAWLRQDLAALGMADTIVSTLPQQVQCGTVQWAEALGVLYVAEGATLGGQVIARLLQQRLGVGPDNGGRFFAAYGPSIGSMWREFVAHLDRQTGKEQLIETAAATTFVSFGSWLRSEDRA